MKNKLLLLLGFLAISLISFGQYTENKLPSGLTISASAANADYVILQKNGENIVKAMRMDTLRSYMVEAMTGAIPVLDSVAGNTGQIIISDGSGWLSPANGKYEGSWAWTFGSRNGAIGGRSMAIGTSGSATADNAVSIAGGNATAIRAVALTLGTASGVYSFAQGNGSVASGDYSFAVNRGTASGENATAWNYGTASGENATAWNYGTASGDNATAWNTGTVSGDNATAWNYGTASGDNATAWNAGVGIGIYSTVFGSGVYANSYMETAIGQYNDTSLTTQSKTAWNAADKLFSIGNGTGTGSESNALVMLKNGNTTATGDWTIDGDLEVTGEFTQEPTLACVAFMDENETLSMTQNNWAQVTNATGDLFNVKSLENFTLSGDTLYCTTDVAYLSVFYAIDAEFPGNRLIKTRIFKNNTEQLGAAVFDGDLDLGHVSSKCVTSATAGDYFVLQIVNLNNNDDATVVGGRMVLIKEF